MNIKDKRLWIIISIVVIIIFLILLITNTTGRINNYISIRSFDTSCTQDSDCNLVSPGCPGSCLPCDGSICARGSWKDRVCPLPIMYRPACKECAIPDFHCECINNECQKVKGTSIKVSGTVEPDPKYVIVNITLPVDNIEEAKLIAAKTCDDTFDEFTEIEEKDNFWIISRTTPNYSDFDVKINKYDGNTECILYG